MSQRWVVRLAQQAEQDFVDIVRWTMQHFGEIQAQRYADTLALAVEALTSGPDLLGSKSATKLHLEF